MKSILHVGRASARDRVSVAADALAEVTAARWRREAAKRRITVDNPVQVRWEWVPGSVLVPLAGRLEQPAGQQDAGLRRCSGRVTELFDEVYGRQPGSRLVVTGAAGAGKSAAMIMLMLTALEQRAALDGAEAGQLPVPVWLSLARWDPVADGLLDWAAATMRREYLFPRGYGPGLAGELLRSGRVALFLDGFDELPVGVRERALALIEALPQGLRVVLTSRAEQYRQARCRVEVAGATVIELWPVSPGDASAYLRAAPARRRPGACGDLADYLDRCPGSAAARALDTPLALSLAGAALADGHRQFADFLGTPKEEAAVQVLVARQMLVRAYPDEASRDRAVSALT